MAFANGDCNSSALNKVTVVLGAQWGDEGKGKIVDLLATSCDIVCRVQGGNNAGHTVVVGDQEYDFHLLPSGIVNKSCKAVIGNGVVVNIPELLLEAMKNEKKGLTWWKDNLIISDRAHLVFDFHQELDAIFEARKGANKLGTTKKGIGPAYSCKASRMGLRICDLMGEPELFKTKLAALAKSYMDSFSELQINVEELFQKYMDYKQILKPMVRDVVWFMNSELEAADHKNILVEGANATMLDIDFGTYPFVTSSNCTVGGVCTGIGIAPSRIGEVIGIVKAYTTRVGTGPLPTEQLNDIGDTLQRVGHEFGVTTGRRRRCGWLDLVVIKYAHLINNFTCIALTKLDILDGLSELKIGIGYKYKGESIPLFPASLECFEDIEVEYLTLPGWNTSTSGCKEYKDLPAEAQRYVEAIRDFLEVPVKWVGVGQERSACIQVYN